MPWGRSSAGVMFCNEPEVLSLRLSVFNYCKVEGWPWLGVFLARSWDKHPFVQVDSSLLKI